MISKIKKYLFNPDKEDVVKGYLAFDNTFFYSLQEKEEYEVYTKLINKEKKLLNSISSKLQRYETDKFFEGSYNLENHYILNMEKVLIEIFKKNANSFRELLNTLNELKDVQHKLYLIKEKQELKNL